ncbi:transposase [Cryptosporangium aurantiacum]|uniref:transposase n=1 Tax=Cryptosporangium aurantiacum TaxID=134849 RepID=UPI000A067A60|nr:transposase [Cryptosporangium aurantiacum]
MVNKHYPAQFKADAVALYRSRPEATIAQIADDLGINRETLRNWVRLDDQRRGETGRSRPSATAHGPASGAVEEENAALRRRVRELEDEREILAHPIGRSRDRCPATRPDRLCAPAHAGRPRRRRTHRCTTAHLTWRFSGRGTTADLNSPSSVPAR